MAIKHEDAKLKFNLVGLAQAMRQWRKKHGFAQWECDNLIGLKSAWASIERWHDKDNDVARATYGLPGVATVEKIVNLIWEDESVHTLLNIWELE
jgi:hypothetical protein